MDASLDTRAAETSPNIPKRVGDLPDESLAEICQRTDIQVGCYRSGSLSRWGEISPTVVPPFAAAQGPFTQCFLLIEDDTL